MKIVVSKWLPEWWCAALTFYPWVFVCARVAANQALFTSIVYRHEAVHYSRQKIAYEKHGWLGVTAWHLRYLLCWPVWKNDFRRQEETLAFQAQGFTTDEIGEILARKPYYLRR